MKTLNNQKNNQDYQILDDKIVYDIDKFNVNKHLTYDILTKELINKQTQYCIHRSVIKLKENIDEDFSPYTINVLCKPFKVSKETFIFKYTDKARNYFLDGEFDCKRMQIQFYTTKNNEISKLYQDLDKHFQTDEFQLKYFKDLGYNDKTRKQFRIVYFPLFTPKDEDYDDKSLRKYNDKYKLKFGVNRNERIITTKIIVKDNKSNRMKEYENLKFEDFKKIENLMSQKNITIQPLINIYNIYSSKPHIESSRFIKRINYGVLMKMKELTFYTNNFDNIIHNIFGDNLDDVKYYENAKIKKAEKEKEKEELIEENKDKEIEKVKEIKIEKTNDFMNNILNLSVLSVIILLNDILLVYYFKNIFN